MNKPVIRPTVGRIVHYHDAKYGLCAAIVVSVLVNSEEAEVMLSVFRPQPPEADEDVLGYTPATFRAEPTVGHWNWPPRE